MTDEAAIKFMPSRQKELGAFYTPPEMAAVLTEWAVRSRRDRVLDPSFGGLAFLAAAHERLCDLGASREERRHQLYGVDLDEDAHAVARAGTGLGIQPKHLVDRDFFEVDVSELPPFQAVVGNPPYVRYQGFNGSAAHARELAAQVGVKLTRLASSWAPFVIHGTSFLAPGGRLAQVLPAELLHAQYAEAVLDFICREFGQVSIALFEERVFPGALEEVVLLFADERGATCTDGPRVVSCKRVADVSAALASVALTSKNTGQHRVGHGQLLAQLLPQGTQKLYERLAAHEDVSRLGDVASVDIGVVTGANEFFVLSQEDAAVLHPDVLKPAVCKAAQVAGARLSAEDHRGLLRAGQRGLLFVADENTPREMLRSAQGHLEKGREAGLHRRYKCRIRDPWWALSVPKAGPPDLLLTYCSNQHPRLATNEVGALNTNTLHGVRPSDPATGPVVAATFYNSLTLLSMELVGRSYGGGVLKLEPTEAEAVIVPPLVTGIEELLPEIDHLVRRGKVAAAADLVDGMTLGSVLGLGDTEIRRLRAGAERLRRRRLSRGKAPTG